MSTTFRVHFGCVDTAMSTVFRDALAAVAFRYAKNVITHRRWAADKVRNNYKSRCLYDRWAARTEDRIIRLANNIIQEKERFG